MDTNAHESEEMQPCSSAQGRSPRPEIAPFPAAISHCTASSGQGRLPEPGRPQIRWRIGIGSPTSSEPALPLSTRTEPPVARYQSPVIVSFGLEPAQPTEYGCK